MARTDPGAARRALADAQKLHGANRFDDALAAYDLALKLDPRLKDARFGMTSILEMARSETFNPALFALLAQCLADREANHQALARGAAHQLRLKHRLDQVRTLESDDGKELLRRLGEEPMLRDFLSRTVNLDPALERFLILLRRHVLLGVADLDIRLMAALARQCFNTEFSFWAEPDEEEAVDSLARTLDDAGTDLPRTLLRIALYRPLARLPQADALAARPLVSWPEALRPLVVAALHDPLEEQRIARELPTFSPIDDEVSRRVQAMYETNPYPRWIALPPLPELDVLAELNRRFPFMAPPSRPSEGPLRVLSGGCGTGQHPLTLARNYRRVAVTAFDLSRSSLAYALRQARRLRIHNVDFFHGDILEVARLGRRFDLIESIGVIHHMDSPDAGLAAFTGVLESGGLIRLGLYSEHARRQIVAARRRIAELGLVDGSTAAIRRFRHLLMTDPAYRDLADLVGWDDFFATSAARDLMFHVQEHRYTVPGIAALLRGAGLNFLGFEFLAGFSSSGRPADTIHAHYRQSFPADPTMTDLGNWARLEERHPDLFQGFTFWAQKPYA